MPNLNPSTCGCGIRVPGAYRHHQPLGLFVTALNFSSNGTNAKIRAVNVADTTINGASARLNRCSYRNAPVVSDSGAARLITDINAANAKPSDPSGQCSAASDSVAMLAIIPATPLMNAIAMALGTSTMPRNASAPNT